MITYVSTYKIQWAVLFRMWCHVYL